MSKRDLYYEMMKLMQQEEEVIKRVRKAEEEVNHFHLFYLANKFIHMKFQTRDLQYRRQQEELSNDLEISVYDIDRNEKSKIYRKLLVSSILSYLSLLRHCFFSSNKKPMKKNVKKKFTMLIISLHFSLLLVSHSQVIFVSFTSIYSR